SAIANGGKLMEPYLVDTITNYGGAKVKKNMPEKYKTLMTPEEAAQLTEYMTAVVTQGTGNVLGGESYTVAGKTGTAEYSTNKEQNHSWFVGFTNVDNPELVISVIVEGSDGSAGTKAVPIAHDILNAYYYN
ncbi:MAG: penicillin-binding transpeptidase domain-containing protein, partial [Lachnospiraceae bacterium]